MGKKLFISLFLLGAAFTASAQTYQVKVGGGFASQYTDKKVVGAFKLGVGYEYEFNQNWTINPALALSGKGWKDKDTFVNDLDAGGKPIVNENGQEKLVPMHRTTSANYLELPVLVNYYLRVGDARYVVFGAGPYVSCGLWGKQETKGDGRRQGPEKLYYEDKTFELDGAHRFDAGIQTVVGFQFPIGVTIGVEADFGLSKFRTDSGRNISGLVSLTYGFKK